MTESLLRLGAWVAEHGIDAPGEHRAARDLLLRRPPRLAGDEAPLQMTLLDPIEGLALRRPGENAVDAASRLALALDGGVLAIQGPPGSGKTFTGARDDRRSRRVGKESRRQRGQPQGDPEPAARGGRGRRGNLRVQPASDGRGRRSRIEDPTAVGDNDAALAAIDRPARSTSSAAPPGCGRARSSRRSVDVLFVDEAGQMSLANVLARPQAAHSLVLLGDPQQLEQPQKGAHPEGADVSALEHVLGDAKTMPPERGLFLDETWRLSPDDLRVHLRGVLRAKARVPARARAAGADRRDAVRRRRTVVRRRAEHEGNQSASAEEVEAIAALVAALLAPGAPGATQRRGAPARPGEDLLIVAPYNAQVSALAARLPGGAASARSTSSRARRRRSSSIR